MEIIVEGCWGGNDLYYWRITLPDGSKDLIIDPSGEWKDSREAAVKILKDFHSIENPTFKVFT